MITFCRTGDRVQVTRLAIETTFINNNTIENKIVQEKLEGVVASYNGDYGCYGIFRYVTINGYSQKILIFAFTDEVIPIKYK